jgi:uncharacterized protein (TIGR00730 family)
MAARKDRMATIADGIIALPGGLGTLEELMDVVVRNQLGYISKPVGVLNTQGYFDRFFDFLNSMVEFGFLPREHIDFFCSHAEPAGLLDALSNYEPPTVAKWMK